MSNNQQYLAAGFGVATIDATGKANLDWDGELHPTREAAEHELYEATSNAGLRAFLIRWEKVDADRNAD
jgi:hypothetical protein